MHRALAALLLAPLLGCSGAHGTASVSGTVLYKGQPVEGATVIFHPKGETPTAKPAQGKTDSGGHFSLAIYFGPGDQPSGALPGDYSVTVTKIDEPQGTFDPHKDPPPKNHRLHIGRLWTSPVHKQGRNLLGQAPTNWFRPIAQRFWSRSHPPSRKSRPHKGWCLRWSTRTHPN